MLNYALIITLVFTLFADSPSTALKINVTKKKKKLALQEEGTRETVITILTLKTDSHLGNAESIRHIRGVICNIT